MRATGAVEPAQIYHVCSRGNNRESIFISSHDREHFLSLYAKHVAPWAQTFAYCLLPNHFHFLLRFVEPRTEAAGSIPPSQRLSNMLNAYARSFNADYHRAGSLFQRPFRRIAVATQEQLLRVVVYIHINPVHHELTTDFRCWRYSSYAALRAPGPTRLARDDVLAWFGGRRGFTHAHTSALEGPIGSGALLDGDLDDSSNTT